MDGEPASSSRQSLVDRAVNVLSQDVDRLAKAAQSCISAGDPAGARENLKDLGLRLQEVEGLLREIDQLAPQPSDPPAQPAASPEPPKRGDRTLRAPCQACGQVYPLRLYRVGWRYRWLCYRCRQTQFPASPPLSPREGE